MPVNSIIPSSSGLIQLLLAPSFRWLCYIMVIILTIIGYIQEPVRFSEQISFLGIPYKYHYYIMICITIAIYVVTFLGLWYTIRWDSSAFSTYWYIPIVILAYAIVTQFFVYTSTISDNSTTNNIVNSKHSLQPPPSYIFPGSTRVWIYYSILILDILIFISALLYAGTSTTFQSTILHKFVLNRFGGLTPDNAMNFIIGWLGLGGLFIDLYIIYMHTTFSACKYGLPPSWDF